MLKHLVIATALIFAVSATVPAFANPPRNNHSTRAKGNNHNRGKSHTNKRSNDHSTTHR